MRWYVLLAFAVHSPVSSLVLSPSFEMRRRIVSCSRAVRCCVEFALRLAHMLLCASCNGCAFLFTVED